MPGYAQRVASLWRVLNTRYLIQVTGRIACGEVRITVELVVRTVRISYANRKPGRVRPDED